MQHLKFTEKGERDLSLKIRVFYVFAFLSLSENLKISLKLGTQGRFEVSLFMRDAWNGIRPPPPLTHPFATLR